MRLLPVLALLACNPTGSVPVDGSKAGGNETLPSTDGDTSDTEDPSDTEDTEDTDTTPYPLTWVGSRVINFPGYCEEAIYEDGEEVTRDSDFEDLVDLCPDCNHLFEASTDTDSICNNTVGVSPTIYRGIILNEEDVEVVLFSFNGGDWDISLETEGEINGTTLTYEYESVYNYYGQNYDFTAEGEIELQD